MPAPPRLLPRDRCFPHLLGLPPLRPSFSQHNDGGAGGGGGGGGARGGGSAGSDHGEDAEAPLLVPAKDTNNQVGVAVGDKRVRSSDKKNDDVEQIKLHLTKMLQFLPSLNNHLITIVNFTASLEHRVKAILDILAQMEIYMATKRDSSAVTAVTDTTANKDAMNRMEGLLGSMYSIADKLPMFCGTIFFWLLTNSPAPNSSAVNSPASKAGQNIKDPWMQVLIIGKLILLFISFTLMHLAAKLMEGLCMILHFFAHTPAFVLWPLGALFSILSLCFWFWCFYKERQKILKELKEAGVLEKGMLPEKPGSEAALPEGSDRANSYAV